jgi:hypothetical protein
MGDGFAVALFISVTMLLDQEAVEFLSRLQGGNQPERLSAAPCPSRGFVRWIAIFGRHLPASQARTLASTRLQLPLPLWKGCAFLLDDCAATPQGDQGTRRSVRADVMKHVLLLLLVLGLVYLPRPKECAHQEPNPPLDSPHKAKPSFVGALFLATLPAWLALLMILPAASASLLLP